MTTWKVFELFTCLILYNNHYKLHVTVLQNNYNAILSYNCYMLKRVVFTVYEDLKTTTTTNFHVHMNYLM